MDWKSLSMAEVVHLDCSYACWTGMMQMVWLSLSCCLIVLEEFLDPLVYKQEIHIS